MQNESNRRSALQKLAVGAAAAGTSISALARPASARSKVDAERKKRKEGTTPLELWTGTLIKPFYLPVAGDARRWTITGQGGEPGEMTHVTSDRKVTMSNSRLARYLERKSGGKMRGQQCLRLDKINWRILHTAYDPSTNTWTIDAELCDSNPGIDPRAVSAQETSCSYAYNCTAQACNCGCGEKCYHCGDNAHWYRRGKYYCGVNYSAACS